MSRRSQMSSCPSDGWPAWRRGRGRAVLARWRAVSCSSVGRAVVHGAICSPSAGRSAGIVELVRKGLLFEIHLASLFRVTWGFVAGGLGRRAARAVARLVPARYQALNPLIQILRPISPIAWIPLAILWFGVTTRRRFS